MLGVEYSGNVSEGLKRKLDKLLKQSFYFTTTKLQGQIYKMKGPLKSILNSNVVYEITFPASAGARIGQTLQLLSARLKEHGIKTALVNKRFVKGNEKLSVEEDIVSLIP